MLPLKGSNRLNEVIVCGLIYLKVIPSRSQWQRRLNISFKLTEGSWKNSLWTLTEDIFKSSQRNCFKLGVELQ